MMSHTITPPSIVSQEDKIPEES